MIHTRRALALLRLMVCYILAVLCILHLGLVQSEKPSQPATVQAPLPPADAPAMQIPFLGTTLALERFSSQERSTALQRLQRHGFGWVRQRFDWRTMEPAPGRFNWAESDAILHDIAQTQLVPVVVLDGSPAWSRASVDTGANDQPLAPPAEPADFAAFASHFATRYGESVRFYQIWDEPNIAPHWGNRHVEPVEYARLLAAGGSAIRAADHNAVILTAALAPTLDQGHTAINEILFLQRLYAAQAPYAPPFFDAVAIQPYGFQYSPNATPTGALYFRRAEAIRQVMVAAGDGATPLWAVRYGWNRHSGSPWSTVTPADQADFAIEALDLARTNWPWLAAMGWAIDQPTPQPVPLAKRATADPQWGFALNLRLLLRFANWANSDSLTDIASTETSAPPGDPEIRTLLLCGLLGIVTWRAWAVTGVLPWRTWIGRLQAAPVWVRVGCWLLLLFTYYLATWLPVIVLCLLVAVLFNFVWRPDGLYLAALVLPFPFQHKELFFLGETWRLLPVEAVLLSLLPALVGQLRRNIFIDRWLVLAGLWLLVSVLSAWDVWHWPAYWEGLRQLVLVPLLLFVAVRTVATDVPTLRHTCVALFAGGLLVAIIGLVRWVGGDGTGADGVLRLVGPHFSPNHTALYLERTLFVGVGFLFFVRGWERLLWAAGSLIVFVALLLTASRGALFLGVPVGCVALALLWQSKGSTEGWHWAELRRSKIVWGGVVIGMLLLGVLLFLFRERLLNSDTLLYRIDIWRATLHLWRDHLWTGVGPGGFFWRYPAYVLNMPGADLNLLHPHNVWMEFVATGGTAGLLWLLAFLWLLQRELRRKSGQMAWPYLGLLVGLLAGLGHGQVDAFGALVDLAGWNWLALGAWSCYDSLSASRSSETPEFIKTCS